MRILLLALLGTPLAAQVASSRLEGVIQDPSGQAVPGARVAAVNTRNNLSAGASSDDRVDLDASA